MDDRARPGRSTTRNSTRSSSATTTPAGPGVYYQNVPDPRAPARGVGRPSGGRAVPAAPVAPRAGSRADRHARVDRRRPVHPADRRGRRRRAVRRDGRALSGRAAAIRGRPRHCAPARSRETRSAGSGSRADDTEPLEVWIGGDGDTVRSTAPRFGDGWLGERRRRSRRARGRRSTTGSGAPTTDARPPRSRCGATCTWAPTPRMRSASPARSSAAATEGSTPTCSCTGASAQVAEQFRVVRRDGLHRPHRAPARVRTGRRRRFVERLGDVRELLADVRSELAA